MSVDWVKTAVPRCLRIAPSLSDISCIFFMVTSGASSIIARMSRPAPLTMANDGCWKSLKNLRLRSETICYEFIFCELPLKKNRSICLYNEHFKLLGIGRLAVGLAETKGQKVKQPRDDDGARTVMSVMTEQVDQPDSYVKIEFLKKKKIVEGTTRQGNRGKQAGTFCSFALERGRKSRAWAA